MPSPRTLKMNSIFDNLKLTIENEEKFTFVDKTNVEYNITSDSDDDDLKRKIHMKKCVTVESAKGKRRNTRRGNESERSYEESKAKTMKRKKVTKRTVKRNPRESLVDKRMSEAVGEEILTCIKNQKFEKIFKVDPIVLNDSVDTQNITLSDDSTLDNNSSQNCVNARTHSLRNTSRSNTESPIRASKRKSSSPIISGQRCVEPKSRKKKIVVLEDVILNESGPTVSVNVSSVGFRRTEPIIRRGDNASMIDNDTIQNVDSTLVESNQNTSKNRSRPGLSPASLYLHPTTSLRPSSAAPAETSEAPQETSTPEAFSTDADTEPFGRRGLFSGRTRPSTSAPSPASSQEEASAAPASEAPAPRFVNQSDLNEKHNQIFNHLVKAMEEFADLNRKSQADFIEKLKKLTFELVQEDCIQNRDMVMLRKEDLQAVKRIAGEP